MTPAALALVAAAALMHALWNALAKRAGDQLVFLWMAMILSALAMAPIALTRGNIADLADWPLAATCSIHAVYFFALGRAYSLGDLSQVYPIARGVSVALVAAGGWLILDERLSVLGTAGVAVVLAGVLVVLQPVREQTPGGGWNWRAVRWAALTGVLVAAYSLVDKIGVSRVDPVMYVTGIGLGSTTLLLPVIWRRRRSLAIEWSAAPGAILAAAALGLTAYLLVLFAFSLSKAAYVVASRELSILASIVLGKLLLGESPPRRRALGAAVIAVGVGLLALSR